MPIRHKPSTPLSARPAKQDNAVYFCDDSPRIIRPTKKAKIRRLSDA
ncbi:hypothetical protein [Neisseria sicca]